MQYENIHKKIGDRAKKSNEEEGNSKSTQTEHGKNITPSNSEMDTFGANINTTIVESDKRKKLLDFNYTSPSLSSYVIAQKDLLKRNTK